MAKNKHIKETDPLKVVYTPVRIVIPIYSPQDIERHRRQDSERRAATERNEKEMRERRADRERRAAHQRRQAIIDDLKIIG